METDRLDRIQDQLDKILIKLETLVRLEERHDGAVKRIDRQEERLDHQGRRIDTLEVIGSGVAKSASMVERIGWVLFSGCVALAVWAIEGGV